MSSVFIYVNSEYLYISYLASFTASPMTFTLSSCLLLTNNGRQQRRVHPTERDQVCQKQQFLSRITSEVEGRLFIPRERAPLQVVADNVLDYLSVFRRPRCCKSTLEEVKAEDEMLYVVVWLDVMTLTNLISVDVYKFFVCAELICRPRTFVAYVVNTLRLGYYAESPVSFLSLLKKTKYNQLDSILLA